MHQMQVELPKVSNTHNYVKFVHCIGHNLIHLLFAFFFSFSSTSQCYEIDIITVKILYIYHFSFHFSHICVKMTLQILYV